MPQAMLDMAGIYGARNQLMKVDVSKEGKMSISSLTAPKASAAEYDYSSDGTFISKDGKTKISFVKEDNGRIYLWTRAYASLPGLGQTAMSQYTAEKLEKNEIPKSTEAVWKERAGQKFYLVNEKYTSLAYLLQPALRIELFDEVPGYVMDQKITGPNSSDSALQIPTMAGRDSISYTFYREDGVEYLETSGNIFESESAVKPIYAGNKSQVTVPANGLAKWYAIPGKAVGKSMQVKMPAHSSYAVYDDKGTCVYFSTISGNHPVQLPENGTLVFAGEAGTKFEISLQ